jgi:3-phosphoshikimate 1-carboxyvinyltransferase
MAFAALGARVADIMVEDPGCVAKTYPQFWEDLASLGGRWEERQ